MHRYRLAIASLLAACGTSPGTGSRDAGGTDVSPDSLTDAGDRPADVGRTCSGDSGFPAEAPPIVFTRDDGAGAIPFDLVPLGAGVAITTDHELQSQEPRGHVVLVSPDGSLRDHWLGPEMASRPQIAAVEDDLLVAALARDGQLMVERRTADFGLVWNLVGADTGQRVVELLGGPSPAVVFTAQTEGRRTAEFVRFSADGELMIQSPRVRIGDPSRVELAWSPDAIAGAVSGASSTGDAEFWWFTDQAPRAMHVLSDRVSSDFAIAWTGDEWAVVYQEHEVGDSPFEVFVAFVSADGTTVNERLMVSEPGQHAVFPDIAAHPGGVTIVWQTAEANGLLSRTVGPGHELGDLVPVSLSLPETSGAMLPKVTWIGDRLAVAWPSYTSEDGYRGFVVFGDRVCP